MLKVFLGIILAPIALLAIACAIAIVKGAIIALKGNKN